ncbi:MAG TPA: YebC/PmpR family DNA-binding transcriptional regulator [Burkholderiales bacterium]|nr:YebC/PmpR family DNA-binding transcriptional regulator [Burkholderiales bacterium]
MGAQWKAKVRETAGAAKGKLFTKLAKEIMVAARAGADPKTNSKLHMAIEQAKKSSMPKDNIERAIKKGAGLDNEGVNYTKLIYEGFAPHRVPLIVECLTDNQNRTASNIRMLFRDGQLGASGSVSWDFDYLGVIEAIPASTGADAESAAIEAGARDLEPGENGGAVFLTEPSDLDAVAKALPASGFNVQSAALRYRPKNPVTLTEAQRTEVETFLEAIHDDDDVQNVYPGLTG